MHIQLLRYVAMMLILTFAVFHVYAQNETLEVPGAFPDRPFIFTAPGQPFGVGPLYFAYGNNTEPFSLTDGVPVDLHYHWSPDGRYLYFQTVDLEIRSENSGRIIPLGNFIHNFTTGEVLSLEATFSGMAALLGGADDTLYYIDWATWLSPNDLALIVQQPGDGVDHFVLNMRDRTYRQLTIPVASSADQYDFVNTFLIAIPDGRAWLNIYHANSDDRAKYVAAYIIDLTTDETTLVYDSGELNARSIQPSNDGTRYAFVQQQNGAARLMVGEVGGGEPMPIYTIPADEARDILDRGTFGLDPIELIWTPLWSPNDNEIAFIKERKVHVINADGTNLRVLDVYDHLINSLTWVSNDILRVQRSASLGGYELLRTDGTRLGAIKLDGMRVEGLRQLPDGIDPTFLSRIRVMTTADLTPPRPTPTPVPVVVVPTPTPFPEYCPGSPVGRLDLGLIGRTTLAAPGEIAVDTRVRATPGGEQIGSLPEGTSFTVIGGPVCANDLTWWQLETLDGAITGWSAEGIAPDDYFLEPFR